jgi:hypothetical protein
VDLAGLLDYELELAADAGAPPAALAARDAVHGTEIAEAMGLGAAAARARGATDSAFRREVIARYVDRRRAAGGGAGARFLRALDLATAILVFLGFLLGLASARAALAYDGHAPVNLFWFLALLVGVQVAMLVLLVTLICRHARPGTAPGPSLLTRALLRLAAAPPFARRLRRPAQRLEEAQALLAARGGLYASALRWSLFARVQRMGVAFNIGVLAATLALLTFTDLAFAWSSTFGLRATVVQRILAVLAGPAGWIWPGLPPDLATVEAVQWTRLGGGRFVSGIQLGEAARLAERFGPFLLASVVSYGFLPRLLAALFGAWRLRRALATLPFDDLQSQRLLERLWPRAFERTREGAPEPAPVRPARSAARPAPPALLSRPPGRSESAAPGPALVLWGALGAEREALGARCWWDSGERVALVAAAGTAGPESDAQAAELVAARGSTRILVLVEEGVPPTREILRLLQTLRAARPAPVPIEVGIVGSAPERELCVEGDDHEVWAVGVGMLRDPHAGVVRRGGPDP